MGNAFLSIMINHRLEKNETSQFRKVCDAVVRRINVFSIFPDDIGLFVARKCNQRILVIEKLLFYQLKFSDNIVITLQRHKRKCIIIDSDGHWLDTYSLSLIWITYFGF